MMTARHRVWKYGDNVNTDVIFPGKYTYTIDQDPVANWRATPLKTWIRTLRIRFGRAM